jgi:hypothetical protein
MNGHKTIPELNKLGMVGYVEPVELTNLYILTNKEEYFFVIDERTPFRNGNFHLKTYHFY